MGSDHCFGLLNMTRVSGHICFFLLITTGLSGPPGDPGGLGFIGSPGHIGYKGDPGEQGEPGEEGTLLKLDHCRRSFNF